MHWNTLIFLGEGGSTKRKRHRKSSTEGGSQLRELQNAISGSTTPSESDKVEVWFHEDCIYWNHNTKYIYSTFHYNK